MNFNKFQDYVIKRYNFGKMEDADTEGDAINEGCGDYYKFWLKIQDDKIIDVKYFTAGCGFAVSTCSIVSMLAIGKTIEEAAKITEEDIENELEGYPEKKKHYPHFVLKAFKNALNNYNYKAKR